MITFKALLHKRYGFLLPFLLPLFLVPSVASAETVSPTPWWGLSLSDQPTQLRVGGAVEQVQEIIATSGTRSVGGGEKKGVLFVLKVAGKRVGLFGTEEVVGEILPGLVVAEASHENIQKALEGPEFYGAGGVTVTGGPAGVAPLVVKSSDLASLEVTADGGTAVVQETVAGRGDGRLVLEAENLGDAPTSGTVTVTDRLPEGMTALGAEAGDGKEINSSPGPVDCTLSAKGKQVTCSHSEVPLPGCGGSIGAPSCPLPLRPFEQMVVRISVRVEKGAKTGELNTASVSGGGAVARTATHPIQIDGPERFGIEGYSFVPESFGGSSDTQAGSHPFQVTSVITANTTTPLSGEGEERPRTVALAKEDVAELPAGLLGNPAPFEQCTDAQFNTLTELKEDREEHEEFHEECPISSVMGIAVIHYSGTGQIHEVSAREPIYNMVPGPGEPARFAFHIGFVPVYLNASVRTGSDYGVTISSHNITQTSWLQSVKLTLWGVPDSPLHDGQRGIECLDEFGSCPASKVTNPPPFMIMPTSCEAPFSSTLHAASWGYGEHASEPAQATSEPEQLDGCNRLPFSPSIEAEPDSTDASSATGMSVDVHVPQEAELNPQGLAESSVRDITVALPPGIAVNPSASNGLEACSEGLVGYEGEEELPTVPGIKSLKFKPRLPGSFGSEEALQPGLNFCSNASKIGTVNIHTPLLAHELVGSVYLADQNANPFGSLIAMYIVAEDPVSGTLVKLPGKVALCQGAGEVIAGQSCGALGQLVTTFENSPQLPFEDAVLHFFGGERAPLASPAHCGVYTTQASFVSWSSNETVNSAAPFKIEHGPGGGPCPGTSLSFSPGLTGGATNLNAGAFSPFTLTMSRKDGEQNLQSVEAHLPPGLSGVLSNIQLCPEPQANLGECPSGSLIGESTIAVGVGGDPFTVSGGKFYLTGPYNGSGSCNVMESGCAPFGITFEVPAKAGPFDLKRNAANPAGEDACDCVIVRGKIEINPYTAALTITSDPPGSPYAIPTSIEGIPLEIQKVNAITTRGNFQFNPTNCAKMEVTGTIHSSENTTDKIGVPFQVTNCKDLAFTPKFKVSTNAKTSKAKGASLTATVSEPAGSLGTQANLTKVKVELPKDLPSRLTTLQKACTSKQFELNPANCPSESKIGYAKVNTPLLPVPLEGPVIFVSHGGEAFPSLTMVLQGDNVTIDIVGATYISKAGVTSTTFKTVPDQPFSSFTLTLPTGKYSALTALGNVCKEKLTMPTEFIAQNGAEIHQTTSIGVTGCAKTLTRSEQLKAALAACRKKDKKSKSKREQCEKAARKKFGAVKPKKKRNGKG
jgi:hypothetical protein